MASRRMFALSVVESDAFLDLSIEARAAYFHLGMHTDDEGFVTGVRAICRAACVPFEAVAELVEGGFVVRFESGVLYLTDHAANNKGLLRKDRIRPTECQAEKMALDQASDICRANDGQMLANGVLTKLNLTKQSPTQHSPTEHNQTEPNPTQANDGAPSAPNHAHAREEPTFEEVKAYAEALPQPVPKLHNFMNRMQINGWPGDWREALERWEG